MGEGKEHAMAIGVMKMSSTEMYAVIICDFIHNPISRSSNQGHGIENVHYLLDGLWKLVQQPA
jgi:predicted ribosome-associated RNA-binding protein Tma20